MKVLLIITQTLINWTITVRASHGHYELPEDDNDYTPPPMSRSNPGILNIRVSAFKGENKTAREKMRSSPSSRSSSSYSDDAKEPRSVDCSGETSGGTFQENILKMNSGKLNLINYDAKVGESKQNTTTGSISSKPNSVNYDVDGSKQLSVSSQTTVANGKAHSSQYISNEQRGLLNPNVTSSIPQDCMAKYFDLFPNAQPFYKKDDVVTNKDTLWLFEPKDEQREQFRLHIIQAIGPNIIKGVDWEVLPVWLRTGRLVFFFRPHNGGRWKPVLQYGSSADDNPFSCDWSVFKMIKYSAPNYADSAILEKAAVELFVMEAILGLPARIDIADWKVFFVLFGLRNDDKINTDVKIKFAAHVDTFNAVLSKSAVDGLVVVPLREEKGWFSSGYNQLSRVYAYSLGTSRGIVKAGWSMDKFPGVINVPLLDCIAHCKRIPADPQSPYQTAFNTLFSGVFASLTFTFDQKIQIYVEGDNELGEDALNLLESTGNCRICRLQPDSSLKPNALGGVYPARMYAVELENDNPVAADMLLAKAAYRLSILVGTEEGLNLLKAQVSMELRHEVYKSAKKNLFNFVANALEIEAEKVTFEDIFYTFSLMCGGKRF